MEKVVAGGVVCYRMHLVHHHENENASPLGAATTDSPSSPEELEDATNNPRFEKSSRCCCDSRYFVLKVFTTYEYTIGRASQPKLRERRS